MYAGGRQRNICKLKEFGEIGLGENGNWRIEEFVEERYLKNRGITWHGARAAPAAPYRLQGEMRRRSLF
jgi:hypothetical protein